MKRGSMSVTSTDPDGPTWSAIHAAHRTAAAAYLEAVPARADAGRLKEAEGPGKL